MRLHAPPAFLTAARFLSGCSYLCIPASPEAKIEAAVEHYVAQMQPRSISLPISDGGFERFGALAYDTVSEFLEDNPNCCTFRWRGVDGYRPHWILGLFHNVGGFVFIDANIHLSEPHSPVATIRRLRHIMVSRCGRVITAIE